MGKELKVLIQISTNPHKLEYRTMGTIKTDIPEDEYVVKIIEAQKTVNRNELDYDAKELMENHFYHYDFAYGMIYEDLISCILTRKYPPFILKSIGIMLFHFHMMDVPARVLFYFE